MGTFHDDLGELHGMTVVVDTPGTKVYIGRCHEMTGEQVVLEDVDVHDEAVNGQSKAEYVQKAAKVGVWSKHPRLVVPMAEVSSVKRLGIQGRIP
jgi:hypothetical protein